MDTSKPAFPSFTQEAEKDSPWIKLIPMGGMSLRDYFAAQALNGIISFDYDNGIDYANYVQFAEYSYKYADAMMEARKK